MLISFAGMHLVFEVFQERELKKEMLAAAYLVLQACISVSRCFRQEWRSSVFTLFAQNYDKNAITHTRSEILL